jgi:pimeloyl-ACP methyl ester carboxylesterase
LVNNDVTGRLVWANLGRYDFHDQLARITAPTLILHGGASVISVGGAEAIHDRIPRSRLIVLEDVGHFPYIEAPQAFEAVVKAFVW